MVRHYLFCFSNDIKGVIVAIEARIYVFLHSQCPGFISSLFRPFFSCSPYPWYPGVKWSELKCIMYTMIKLLIVYPYIGGWPSTHFHTDMYIYIYKPVIFGFSWKGDYQKPTRQSCGTFATSRLYGRIAQKRVAWSNVRCWDVVFFPCPWHDRKVIRHYFHLFTSI